jgi:hypothetical protein
VTRALPEFATLVAVTPLLLLYGSTDWSWLGGPVAALAIWAVDVDRRDPAETVPASLRLADPEAVD